jgi:hypothetical protein
MKLSPWTIYIIGLFLAIPILAFGYFMHYQPDMQEAADKEKVAADFRTEGAKLKKADQRRHDAVKLVEEAAAKWNAVAKVRTPPVGLSAGFAPDLSVNAWQLALDTRKYRNNLQVAINRQLHAAGVEIVNGGFVPDIDVNAPANSLLASYYNFTTFGFPVVILNLGQIQVTGTTYKQIFDHVKSWANFPHYLAVTDSLALTGTTPSITGTYNLTIVGFIPATTVAPAVPEAQTASTGTSPFGGGGPPGMGGFPGASAPGGGPPPGAPGAARGAKMGGPK